MIMKPWESEVEISDTIAKEIIQNSVKDFEVKSIKLFAQGWDKTGYLVNGDFLFHFCRREVAIQGIELEIKTLPFLSGALPVPIPSPVHHGHFGSGFPFFSYQLLEGTMAVDLGLTQIQREEMAVELGEILRSLHQLPLNKALKAVLPVDLFGRLDINKRKAQIMEQWPVIQKTGLQFSESDRDKIIRNISQQMANNQSCIVHGDLYTRHLLIKNETISGIIDWGDAHLNHPACDLAFPVNFLNPDALKVFMAHYGDIDSETFLLSLFRALNHTLYVSDYALNINDINLANESRVGLKNIFDNYSTFIK